MMAKWLAETFVFLLIKLVIFLFSAHLFLIKGESDAGLRQDTAIPWLHLPLMFTCLYFTWLSPFTRITLTFLGWIWMDISQHFVYFSFLFMLFLMMLWTFFILMWWHLWCCNNTLRVAFSPHKPNNNYYNNYYLLYQNISTWCYIYFLPFCLEQTDGSCFHLSFLQPLSETEREEK